MMMMMMMMMILIKSSNEEEEEEEEMYRYSYQYLLLQPRYWFIRNVIGGCCRTVRNVITTAIAGVC